MSVAAPPTSQLQAGPQGEDALEIGALCPLCSSPLDPAQDWCLHCGAAARTRLAASPRWKVLVVLLAAVALLALAVLAAALVKLAGDSGSSRAPSSVRSLASPTGAPAAVPTTASPPAASAGPTTPGSTAPPATRASTAPPATPGGTATGAAGAAAASTVPSGAPTTTTPAQGLATPGAGGRRARALRPGTLAGRTGG